MPSKIPTPHTLIIVTPGVNHSLQYKGAVTATAAYRALKELTDKKAPQTHELIDDYGARVTVDCAVVSSLRLTDIAEEHRANMNLKLCELYAALEFEELVKTDHAGLTLIKARNPSGLIRAQ